MNRPQLVKLFFDQTKPSGRASAIYFEGRVLYSYGRHFPLAIIHGGICYLNHDKYSPSTGRHQSAARSGAMAAGLEIHFRDTEQMKGIAADV